MDEEQLILSAVAAVLIVKKKRKKRSKWTKSWLLKRQPAFSHIHASRIRRGTKGLVQLSTYEPGDI